MHPSKELRRIAARKAVLRASIGELRTRSALAAGRVFRPLVLLDRGIASWRRTPPAMRLSLLLLLAQLRCRLFPAAGRVVRVAGWGSLVVSALRLLSPVLRALRSPGGRG